MISCLHFRVRLEDSALAKKGGAGAGAGGASFFTLPAPPSHSQNYFYGFHSLRAEPLHLESVW